MEILKYPEFEDDSYLIRIKDFSLSAEKLETLLKNDGYLHLKYRKFKEKDISPEGFQIFSEDRPSLKAIKKLKDVEGSIYTHKVGKENRKDYDQILTDIKFTFLKHPETRRLVVRVANSFEEYNTSVEKPLDVSCLNLIHYLKDGVKLVFRSSDIKNELFVDIITIYEFFIRPIYKNPVNIEIFASTSQNIDYIEKFKNKIGELYG